MQGVPKRYLPCASLRGGAAADLLKAVLEGREKRGAVASKFLFASVLALCHDDGAETLARLWLGGSDGGGW